MLEVAERIVDPIRDELRPVNASDRPLKVSQVRQESVVFFSVKHGRFYHMLSLAQGGRLIGRSTPGRELP
jgi:hypothetical protein